jgi:uncharacterized membrane protein
MGKRENFSITLTPHRSLTREGFVALMAIFGFLNLAGGLLFLVAGAWPIFGFMGLDVALLWWAFRRSFADGRRAERIKAEGERVWLTRITREGVELSVEFNRRWLSVELEHDDVRELVGRLYLRSHGMRHEIASFLGAEERLSLSRELMRAL